jgi:NAD(P)-dependent dehydrogenase (short-subunit alcohol dehydrogenase family)
VASFRIRVPGGSPAVKHCSPGADSGIGRAAAIAFAREGADVAICYLPEEQEDAEEVAKYIRAAGRKAVLLPGDVSHEGFCQRLVAEAVEQLDGFDILVNNAGKMGKTEGLLETSTQRFDSLMKTNIYSIFWITKAAVPHLKPGSSIINTTSIQGFEPSADIFDYAITKAAIANFTKGLSEPLMEAALKLHHTRLTAGDVALIRDFRPPAVASVFGSEILQVVANLLLNSLDALPKRDAKLRIRVETKNKAVHITVSDNGSGMSPQTLKNLFQPYVTTKNEGTGLGLWLSRGIVKKHRGKLVVRSSQAEGRQGTTFRLSIPLQFTA